MLWSGVSWERLPREAFGCTGMTPDRGPGQAVLAAAARLACRRRAGRAAPGAARAAGRGGRARLGPGVDRQRLDPGRRGRSSPGTKIGPNPTDRGRPGYAGATSSSMPAARRWASRLERGQPPRQQVARGRAGRRAGRAPRPGQAPLSAPQAPRGQGLRPPPLPRRVPRAVDHPAHRAPGRRMLRPPRPPPLGGRAHARLARALPTPHHPLRAPGRHPPGLHLARLFAHLPQPNQTVLSGALRPC